MGASAKRTVCYRASPDGIPRPDYWLFGGSVCWDWSYDAIPFGRRTGSLELAGRTFKGLLAEFDVADHTVDLSFTVRDSANSIQLLERPKLGFENLELL